MLFPDLINKKLIVKWVFFILRLTCWCVCLCVCVWTASVTPCPTWTKMTSLTAIGGVLIPGAKTDMDCINYCAYSMTSCLAAQVFSTSSATATNLVCVVHTDPLNLQYIFPMQNAILYFMNCTSECRVFQKCLLIVTRYINVVALHTEPRDRFALQQSVQTETPNKLQYL